MPIYGYFLEIITRCERTLDFWKFPYFGRSIKGKVRGYPPSSAKLRRHFRISGDLSTKVRTIDLFTQYFVCKNYPRSTMDLNLCFLVH